MAVNIQGNQIVSTASKPSIDADYGPYTGSTLQEALNSAESALKYKKSEGKTIGIKVGTNSIIEYWYKFNNNNELSLTEKTPDLSSKQDIITNSNKLDADLVDDANSDNKFVTSSEKTIWNGKQNALTTEQLSNITKGGTALQPSSTSGLLKNDGTVDTETQSKAANAIQMPTGASSDKVLGYDNGAVAWVEKPSNGQDGAQGPKGDDGEDAVNPFKGYYPSGVSLPASGAVGDYLYATPSDPQSTATATIWHYDSTQTPSPWTDTEIDVSAVVALEFGSGQSVPATKIKDENGVEVSGPAGVLSAEAGEALNENKLDKVTQNTEWQQQEPTENEQAYINQNGDIVSSLQYTTKTYAVTGGKKYKVKGRRAGSASRLACFYVDDGEGGLVKYEGSVDRVGSEGVGDNITSVSNPVPDGDYDTSQGAVSDYHTEVYIAPNDCVAIKIMTKDQQLYPVECSELMEDEIDNQDVIESVGDVSNLETTDKSSVVNAINEINEKAVNAEEEVENKLDKTIEEESETWETIDNVNGYPINGYLYQDGTEAGPTLTTGKIAKFEVEEGKTYYITGSTTTSTHQCVGAFYDINGDVIAGSIIRAQEANARVSREQHTAPSGAKYLKVMQNNSATDYPATCETKESVTTTKNNQTIIDSVGNVTDLDTENKDTIVDAINELNGKISGSVVKSAPNVLLIGSSHGMNTISQLPWMLYGRGYRGFKVGNIYGGSLSIEAIAQYMMSGSSLGTNVTYQEFNDNGSPAWGKNTSLNTYPSVLNVGWDVISIQRSAYEDEVWDCSKASAFRYVIDYIKNYCADHSLKIPRIIINSGFTDGNYTLQSLDTTNLAIVHNIMDTVKEASKALKVDYYPTAMAIANARNTWMGARASNYGIGVRRNLTYDGQHLDYGMGCWIASLCLYECVMKPLGDSIQNVDGYGTQVQQYVFTTAATSTNYTEPTEETMQIARDCVWAAYNDDSELNTEITAQYNYPYKVEVYASGVTLTGNDTKKESVAPGGSYGVGFEAVSGFTLSSVYVEMNGVDITSTAYDSTNHSINITNVNGNIKIIIKTVH